MTGILLDVNSSVTGRFCGKQYAGWACNLSLQLGRSFDSDCRPTVF